MRRREDGFHDLASLFHVISLGDMLSFEDLSEQGEDELTCNWADVPTGPSNLVCKALALFRKHTGVTTRYAINLTKTVPHGAGLGGGSGNAATALWAANQLAGRPAKDADLLRWAGEIGSDISVFFSHGAAYCTGRGEIVENCSPPVDLKTRMLLVKPVESLPTPAIFKALDLRRCSTADPNILLESLRRTALVPQELCVNDLETPAFETLPALAELKESLIATGLYKSVFMTGSGSTMVCMGSDEVPEFVARNTSLFNAPARLIVRDPDGWYQALDDVELAAVA